MRLIRTFLGLLLPFAFDGTHMNRLHAGTNGLWLYKTTVDTNATVQGAGYFNSFANQLIVGDIILIAASNEPDLVMVSSNDGTTVGITALNVV